MVRKYVVYGMVEVMYPGRVVKSTLCRICILAWRFVEGAEYWVVKFSMKFITACYDVSWLHLVQVMGELHGWIQNYV